MNVFAQRSIASLPVVALIMLALLAGVLVVWSPLAGGLAVLGGSAVLMATRLVNERAIRRAALAICALIIIYPAFLPRRAINQSYATIGEVSGSRAAIQLAIILGVALVAAWLWLSTPGALAAFLRAPLRLLALYGGVILISLLYTPDIQWAGFAALKLLEALLVLAVLAALVRTTAQLKQVIDVMLGAIGLMMLIYWSDIVTGAAVVDSTARYRTSWIHPNHASLMAFLFTSIVAARFFTEISPRRAAFAGLLTCFGAVTSFVIAGKTGLVGGALALVLVVVVTMIRLISRAWLLRMLLVSLGLVLAIIFFMASNVGIAAHLRAYSASEYLEVGDLTGRMPLWATRIEQGMASPIFGYGYMSTFADTFDNGYGWVSGQAHNSFIQTFFDLGLPGLLIIVALYLATWYTALRQIVAPTQADERWRLSVELLAALTVVTVNSFTEDIFGGIFESRTMLFLLVVFAIYQLTWMNRWAAAQPAPDQSRELPIRQGGSARARTSHGIAPIGGEATEASWK